jgi:hypothetical protein
MSEAIDILRAILVRGVTCTDMQGIIYSECGAIRWISDLGH